MQKSDRIYHGCFKKNQDGTKRLKKKTEVAYALQTNLFGNIRKTYRVVLKLVHKKKIKN